LRTGAYDCRNFHLFSLTEYPGNTEN
jgi:hypothetical protein